MSFKISIVTPTYNQGQFIEKTIQSVACQEGTTFEHIIIDGGSSDQTIPILKKYPHLNWISERDNGQSDAINKGFKKVSGEIVAWQNSDDYYLPSAFAIVERYFDAHPECMMVYGDCLIVNEKSQPLYTLHLPEWDYFRFITGRFCPLQPAVFFRKTVIDECGGVDESLHYVMDVDFFARIARKYKIHHIPMVLGAFRAHDESKTTNMLNRLSLWKEFNVVAGRYEILTMRHKSYIYFYRIRNILGYYYKRYFENSVKKDRM